MIIGFCPRNSRTFGLAVGASEPVCKMRLIGTFERPITETLGGAAVGEDVEGGVDTGHSMLSSGWVEVRSVPE